MSFEGFDPAVVALLDDLPTWTADEHARHKEQLASGLTSPAADLIADVAGLVDADLSVAKRSSVSPLHRDLRFAPAGSPRYKDHLLLTTWEGSDKKTAPVFWIRVDAHRVGLASGIGFSPVVRERWRNAVAGAEGEALAAALGRLVDERSAEIAGDEVGRVPTPHPADHPRADLLRKTGFQVRVVEPLPSEVASSAFASWCAARLGAMLPVHRWLVANLT